MQCPYCLSSKQDGANCDRCGAPMNTQTKTAEYYRSTPEFYNGYIVYWIRDYLTNTVEAQFWLGLELQERIVLTRDALRDFVPEYQDPMPFMWDLFLLAHGEKDVIEYQEKNNKYPARFEVRRIENPERERFRGLSMFELAQEVKA